MGTNHYRDVILYLLSISCILLCLNNNEVYSQVTIKERMELSGEEPNVQVQPEIIPFLSNDNAVAGNAIEFTAEQDGQIAIVFENGIKFSSPFSNSLKISVTDTSGNLKYVNNFSPDDYFTNSAQGQMTPDCSEDWYLYGNGPFVWNSGTTDDAIDDSWVFSLGCDQDYAQETGRCQTSNFGENGDLNLWSWTWSGDFAVIRSFLRFNGLNFSGPLQLQNAILSLFELGGDWGSHRSHKANDFWVNRVTGSWQENAITWVNQPGATTPQIAGPGGASDVNIDVSSIVESWLTNPGSNNGFRLALQTETDPYRLRAFHTSEGANPPRLRLTVDNPEAGSDTLRAGFVKEGDLIRLEYESSYTVSNTNSETSMDIGGETVSGRDNSFKVEGPSCNTKTSEYVEFFAWIDEAEAPDLQITMEFPDGKEVWPTLRDNEIDGGNPDNRNKLDFIVTVIEDDQPVSNADVFLTAEMIEESGGHHHLDELDQRRLGTFLNTRTSETGEDMLNTTTGNDGRIELEYTAMEFGGVLNLTAMIQTPELKQVNENVSIRVPGLVPLGTNSFYELVGSPDNYSGTNDPCRPSPPKSLHYNNHYGTPALVNAVENIASAYSSLFPDERLRINDMSLENGGVFDIFNNWNVPHRSHRIGINADIGFKSIGINNECPLLNQRDIEKIIRNETGIRPLKEGNHYHIYVNQ